MSKYCPHGEFSRRHQFSRKKNSVSALDSSGSFLLVFLSDGEGGCFFIQMNCVLSGEEIRSHRYGQKVCLHTQPPSHLSQHHLVSFWGKLREFRDFLRQGPLPSPRGGDVSSQSCFQGKYYLLELPVKKMQLTPLKSPQCEGDRSPGLSLFHPSVSCQWPSLFQPCLQPAGM